MIDSCNLFNQERQKFIYSKYYGYNDPQKQQRNYFYVFQKKYQFPYFILETAQKIDSAHQANDVSTSAETNNQISNHTFFTGEESMRVFIGHAK